MILFEDALKTVLSQEWHPAGERVSLSDSLGRVLAEDIFSDLDMPPFDKSAVDGYACMISDFPEPATGMQSFVELEISETIAAGSVPKNVVIPGRCSKIMTGAMIPSGADCVIMVEDTEQIGESRVRINRKQIVKNICYRSEDITKGDRVLQKGMQVSPAHIAVLAGVGAVNPLVAKLPRVAIISTGDELVEPGITPGHAQIRNSNAWQLEAQVKGLPALPCYYGIVGDAGPGMRKIINLALDETDVVLLTGGVSMGDFDFVPVVMQEAGVEILFKSIAIQPGKPTVFGRRNKTYIFGLPGNPVSSFVLFEMMVKPFLHRMMGCSIDPITLNLPIGVDFSRRKSGRKSMIPVNIRNEAIFPVEYHGSAHINAYSVANGIMILEIGTTDIKKGELVHVRPL